VPAKLFLLRRRGCQHAEEHGPGARVLRRARFVKDEKRSLHSTLQYSTNSIVQIALYEQYCTNSTLRTH